jgi:hypothetical protein
LVCNFKPSNLEQNGFIRSCSQLEVVSWFDIIQLGPAIRIRLPRVSDLECDSSSVCDRTVKQLSTIFVPTLMQLIVQDDAASHWEEGVQIQSRLWGVSWLLWLEPGPYFYHSGLWIDTATFEHFVHTVDTLNLSSLAVRMHTS